MCLIVYKFCIFWSFRPICSKLKKKHLFPQKPSFPEVEWNAVAIFHLEGDIPTKPGFPCLNTISNWQHVSSFDLRLSYVPQSGQEKAPRKHLAARRRKLATRTSTFLARSPQQSSRLEIPTLLTVTEVSQSTASSSQGKSSQQEQLPWYMVWHKFPSITINAVA